MQQVRTRPVPNRSLVSPRTTGSRRLAALLTALSLGLSTGCGGCAGGKAAEVSLETIRARDLASEYMIQDRKELARKTMAPLVAKKGAAAEDLVRAACIELAEEKLEEALPFVERATKLAPDDPRVAWCRYRVARMNLDNAGAAAALKPLLEEFADDYTVQLAYALALDDLEEPDAEKRAEERYRALLELPDEVAESWVMVTLTRMQGLLLYAGKREEAEAVVRRLAEYRSRDVESPGEPKHQAGTLGEVLPHTSRDFTVPAPVEHATTLEARQLLAGAHGFTTARNDRGVRGRDIGIAFGSVEELFAHTPGPLRIAAFGPAGLDLLRRGADGSWSATKLVEKPVTDALPFDRKDAGATPTSQVNKNDDPGDQELDLVVSIPGEGTVLLENVERASTASEMARATHPLFPETASAPGELVRLDYDHDGDVDLALCTGGAGRLYRNDGLDVDVKDEDGEPTGAIGPLVDVTNDTTMPDCPSVMIPEDLDRDSDIDFVCLEEVPKFLSSLRAGRFAYDNDELPKLASGTRQIAVADFDGDSWVDLACFQDTELLLYTRTPTGAWKAAARRFPLAHAATGRPIVCDWDLDGTNDLFWPTATHPAVGLLAPGFENGGIVHLLGDAYASLRSAHAQIAALDLDGDGDHDLLRADADGGLWEYRFEGQPKGVDLELMGYKDSAHGVGAIAELRKGRAYRRFLWQGGSQLVGIGGEMPDVIRIKWPNGVVENTFDPPKEDLIVWQRIGLQGSCPFLYTWNGETYEFISDVIGITPLGLPMAPGQLVPPDHDEYVLVRGDQLVPKDGFYEMHFTEELREVTYLDRIRLDVVDHPEGVEVFPEERFSFPPFPPAHTHTMADPLSPSKAVGSDGRDWTSELATDDKRFARPFRPYGDQWRGLAEPYFLELAFDPERVRDASKLRLAMNGWLVWTDASVNVAAARHPEREFLPPLLQVPDGQGGWRDTGPPLGFPAGKLKTMVIDVTDRIRRDDPRIRLVSTLVLYWDSIRLATDADDAPLVVTPLEASSAELWERGFSEPIPWEIDGQPVGDLEWFEWERIAELPRWNQHPGFYTRYGDVRELLGEVDDRFCILGAGDAMTVRFDASKAPPVRPGWTRSFLVFLDGWAKDRDHNTEEALYVKPYPFHGMSGYPYGPDESFPDTEEHRRWEREWNTRPAKQWIRSIVPSEPGAGGDPMSSIVEASLRR